MELPALPAPRWILRPAPIEAMRRVETCGLALTPLVRKLLAQRQAGTPEEIERFLNPRLRELSDPLLIPGMAAAVDRLLHAADRQEHVVLYGDYDVDGVCSLTLLRSILGACGLEVRCFLPLRMEEGYGVSREGMERCLSEGPVNLLVAVDCGTTSGAEAAWLAERGIEMMVIDHHEPDPARLPSGIVVNPKLGDSFHYLCSAGVAFKLGHAIGKRRRPDDFDLRAHLDLVALATVADIVPLVDENRMFVRKGIRIMENTARPGLRALMEVAGVKPPLDSMDFGFRMGPRLNAAGRLDTAQTALDLMLCSDNAEAAALAQTLDGHNRERQNVEHRMQAEAQEIALRLAAENEPPALVVASRGWHPGVVGIVAARLMRKFHRPVFVVAIDDDGVAKGSGRSVDGISLTTALNACRDLLLSGGGHDAAAGLSLHENNLEAFRHRFADAIAAQVTGPELEPRLVLDAETRLGELTLDFLKAYELLQPFGQGNPRPLFFARAVQPSSEPRLLNERHWKFEFYQDGTVKSGVWFNGAHDGLPDPPWDIAFYIDRNTWRGETYVQLLVQAMRTSGEY